jgi:Domain of unknown function (DUF6766)
MRRFIRDNALTLFFGVLCVLTMLGDALVGHRVFNEEALQHEQPTISFWRYLVSADFGEAMSENWQSEFLQFVTFIVAGIWLFQRGSIESKEEKDLGLQAGAAPPDGSRAERAPLWAKMGGLRTQLYSHSLVAVMLFFFLFSWFAQSVTQWKIYNSEQTDHHDATVGYLRFLGKPQFWEFTFQNWQSEFMALATMAIFTVFLRQKGSPESKPVPEPHESTGVTN